MNDPSPPPRLTAEPFPPYSYVPGRFPHPVNDPRGHCFGQPGAAVVISEGDDLFDCAEYRRGIDLFNHGYYWEAHEAWEAVWNACGRKGPKADFIKGLIKLAAAGVKAREGRPEGVARHAARARQLFESVAVRDRSASSSLGGLTLSELTRAASELARHPQTVVNVSDAPVVPVLSFFLRAAAQ